jgi:hypothetical protein
MAFVAEVKARLGLDTTEFQRALTKTQSDLGQLGKDTNRKLARSFGGDDAIKGLLQGAGIGSLEAIVSKLTEGFRTAAESAKQILEHSAETLGIYEKMFAGRRTDQQNLDANLAKQARLQREILDTTEKSESRTVYGPGGAFSAKFTTRDANPERAAEIAKELAQLSAEELTLKEKAKKTSDETAVQQQTQQTAQIASRMKAEQMERANYEKTQTDEQNLKKLQEDRAKISTLASETDYDRKQEIAELDGKILDLQKKITDETAKRATKQEELNKKLRNAAEEVAKSQADEDEAFADRSSLSLEEAAKSGSGSIRTQARRIQFLESRAKRRRGSGFDAEAFEDTSRALKLRSDLSALSKSERDPMENARTHIHKSMVYLEEIRDNLKPEEIE